MKNTAINTLKYAGIVTLSQYVGTKKVKIAKVHNEGGSSLFKFLTSCLVGDFTLAKVTRPTKIRLVRRNPIDPSDPGSGYSYKSESGFIYLLSQPATVDSSTEGRVRYSFIVSKDQIEHLDGNYNNLGIALYTDNIKADEVDLSNYAAFCELTTSTTNSLINASLVVDWELIISNPVD